MTNHTIKLALAAAIAICFASPLTAQRYSFQDLDIPDVVELSAYDINNDNVVVGTLVEIFDGEEFEDGFVWDDGEFFFPFVDVFLPSFNGINDLGTIVGVGIDVDEFSFASFFAEGEEVTLFGFPGAPFTFADGINNEGEIVGQFAGDFNEENIRSFHRQASGEIAELTFQGYPDVVAIDINNLGQIVGGVYDNNGVGSGFIYGGGELQLFNHPDGETELVAINDLGVLAGYYEDDEGILRSFVFEDGEFHDVMFPGAADTTVWSVNNHGVIVGEYMLPGEEFYRAFVGFPVPEPSSHMLMLMVALFAWPLCRAGRPRVLGI